MGSYKQPTRSEIEAKLQAELAKLVKAALDGGTIEDADFNRMRELLDALHRGAAGSERPAGDDPGL